MAEPSRPFSHTALRLDAVGLSSQRDGDQLSSTRLAELLELTQDAILVRDLATSTVIYWNRGAERLYGWSQAEAHGQVTHTLLQTRFPVSRDVVDTALTADGYWEGELIHRRRDGNTVVVASRQAVQCDEQGAPAAILEINTDTTQRRLVEEERVKRAAEQRGRQIAERALHGLSRLQAVTAALSEAVTTQEVAAVVMNEGITALEASAGAICLLDSATGHDLDVVALSGYTADVRATFQRFPLSAPLPVSEVLRDGQPEYLPTFEAVAERYPHLAETHRAQGHAAVATVPLVAHGHAIGGMTLSFDQPRAFEVDDRELLRALAGQCAQAIERARLYELALQTQEVLRQSGDELREIVHERDRALADLRKSLQTRDSFLAAASHDLKNPLASIKVIAQLLQRRLSRPEAPDLDRVREGLVRLDATATRAAGQVDELLDVARLELGRPLDLERRPTDLIPLAKEIAAEHQQVTERHQVQIETDVVELIGAWDSRRLARVLANLLDNALKYSPQGGTVALRITAKDVDGTAWAVVEVHDDGIGIPAADLDHIFERFHRATNVQGRIGGTGIGLASVRHIVESHGGTVAVTSREGAGSTFIVCLPLTSVAVEDDDIDIESAGEHS